MTTPAAQTTLTAPGGRKPIPGGRKPIPSGAPPGAPPEGAPFQSALKAEWARTATAEGQQQSHSDSPSPPANNSAANVAASVPHTPAAHDAKDGASGLPAAPELEGSSADAKGADPVPGIHTGAPPAGDSTPPPVGDPAPPPAGNSTPIAESPALPASDATPAGGNTKAHPAGWVGPDPSTTQGKASPPLLRAPAAGATLSSSARFESASTGGGGWTHDGTNAGDGSWSSQAGARRPAEQQGPRSAGGASAHDKLWVPDAAQASPGGDAAGGGVATGGAGGLAEGSGSAQVSATSSGGQAEIGQQGPLLDYGVGLQQAIETLHGTIQLAARQGLAQARIALEPEGLGEIRIHLTQTAQGLLARVTAETPAAAQALAAAHAELRQSLSSLGIDLARLSVGRHGHSAAQDGGTALGGGGRDSAAGGEASSRGARSGQTAATAASSDLAPDPEAEEDAQPAPTPARGTLVDVLA